MWNCIHPDKLSLVSFLAEPLSLEKICWVFYDNWIWMILNMKSGYHPLFIISPVLIISLILLILSIRDEKYNIWGYNCHNFFLNLDLANITIVQLLTAKNMVCNTFSSKLKGVSAHFITCEGQRNKVQPQLFLKWTMLIIFASFYS